MLNDDLWPNVLKSLSDEAFSLLAFNVFKCLQVQGIQKSYSLLEVFFSQSSGFWRISRSSLDSEDVNLNLHNIIITVKCLKWRTRTEIVINERSIYSLFRVEFCCTKSDITRWIGTIIVRLFYINIGTHNDSYRTVSNPFRTRKQSFPDWNRLIFNQNGPGIHFHKMTLWIWRVN